MEAWILLIILTSAFIAGVIYDKKVVAGLTCIILLLLSVAYLKTIFRKVEVEQASFELKIVPPTGGIWVLREGENGEQIQVMTLDDYDEWMPSGIDQDDVKEASVEEIYVGETIQSGIVLTLTTEGRDELAKVTGENISKEVTLEINGETFATPVITGRIENGQLSITGNFTEEEAQDYSTALVGHYYLTPFNGGMLALYREWRDRNARLY